jgi:hypothetical protein
LQVTRHTSKVTLVSGMFGASNRMLSFFIIQLSSPLCLHRRALKYRGFVHSGAQPCRFRAQIFALFHSASRTNKRLK